MNEYKVLLTWDDEAQRWYCTSEDIPGLILESGSLDVLVGRDPANASLSFKAERRAAVFA